MMNEFWKAASRAGSVRTDRGQLSVWHTDLDARFGNVCLAVTLKSAHLTTCPSGLICFLLL
jgi:hypothetical protein